MDVKKTMFDSIEHIAGDVLKIQDFAIQLRRESEELHVMPEHQEKLSIMKKQLSDMHQSLQELQEYILSCQRRAEHPTVMRSTKQDVWL